MKVYDNKEDQGLGPAWSGFWPKIQKLRVRPVCLYTKTKKDQTGPKKTKDCSLSPALD